MPKFNGQNKKRNNPRYFLNEVETKEEIKEMENSWDKYDDLMAKAGSPGEEWQAPWNSTEEMIDKLADQAREASKAINGYKVDVEGMTIAQLRDLLHSMGNSDVQRSMDDESERESDAAIGMQDDEDNSPKRMGMGRMEEEKPKKKGKYDNKNGKDEKCDHVPCGDDNRKHNPGSKTSKLEEMIKRELASIVKGKTEKNQ